MTADGSYGQKGFVTDAFDKCEYACACGPLPMLRALDHKVERGQSSLEARMGCWIWSMHGMLRTVDEVRESVRKDRFLTKRRC